MENIFYGKNRKIFLTIHIILIALWLTFIFYNSFSDGIRSTEQSNRVVELLQNFLRNFDPEAMVDASVVRTTAHFVEFLILGALYYIGTFFIRQYRVSLFFHSLSLSLFTAFVDETIQLFSNGRGADVKDIWTDLSGAIVAHVIIFAIYYTYKYFKTASK